MISVSESAGLLAWLDGATKSFGQVVAISEVSFAIPAGKILGFLGPNGAGKTTSIRLLLGLIKPDFGQVRIFNQDPFRQAAVKQAIGYVPEYPVFPKWITASNFLKKFGQFHLVREEAKKRALEVLEEVFLSEVANKRIIQFSKGMKQRIKIAQAIMHKPKLVIADEPFNGLDPVVRAKIFDLLRKYRELYETTFFVSSHILFEVDKLADQIVLLYKGRTIAQGAPRKIRAMLQEQPHSIQITSSQSKALAILLIQQGNEKLISSIEFTSGMHLKESQLIITTLDPGNFYHLLTDIVADNHLLIKEIKATDEGLEALFKTLTVG